MKDNLPDGGWTWETIVTLPKFGDAICEACDQPLRHQYLVTHEATGTIKVGAECAARLVVGASAEIHRSQAMHEDELSDELNLPAGGWFVPPVQALNAAPFLHVSARRPTRFALLQFPKPTRVNIHEGALTGVWVRCAGAQCHQCDIQNAPQLVYVVGACKFDCNDRGRLLVPANYPYGCTEYKIALLREIDYSAMHTINPKVFSRDWLMQRAKDGTYSLRAASASHVGTSEMFLRGRSFAWAKGEEMQKFNLDKVLPEGITISDAVTVQPIKGWQ